MAVAERLLRGRVRRRVSESLPRSLARMAPRYADRATVAPASAPPPHDASGLPCKRIRRAYRRALQAAAARRLVVAQQRHLRVFSSDPPRTGPGSGGLEEAIASDQRGHQIARASFQAVHCPCGCDARKNSMAGRPQATQSTMPPARAARQPDSDRRQRDNVPQSAAGTSPRPRLPSGRALARTVPDRDETKVADRLSAASDKRRTASVPDNVPRPRGNAPNRMRCR